jgi:2-polyprenyl-3-methyl-5-hydroxy-6-metoxy-1,4-benzoquinol methylase
LTQTAVNPPEWGGDELGALNGSTGEQLATVLVEEIARQPAVRTICDLGCGNGYLADRLGKRGFDVTGIDGSQPYVDTANRLYASPSVRFERAFFAAALAERYRDHRFDLVVSSDVIEHLYRPDDLLETAFAVLKPRGTVIIGTPYYGYLKNLAISALGKWDLHHGVHWDGGHIKLFSVETLRLALERNGFSNCRFVYYGRLPYLWKNMICVAEKPR